MARQIKEILDGMKRDFVRNDAMRNAFRIIGTVTTDEQALRVYNNTFSAANVVSLLMYVVACCAAYLENVFDWFQRDVNNTIANERYGYKGWYENIAKQFRYSQGLSSNYDIVSSGVELEIVEEFYKPIDDPALLEELQIVKFAHCSANSNGNVGVVLKIASSDGHGNPQMVGGAEYSGERVVFERYINRVKPAGIPVTVINRPADLIDVSMTVWYDPLVMDENGVLLADGEKPIMNAVMEYLKRLDFNGEFITMRMVDAIQQVEGVEVVDMVSVMTKNAGHTWEDVYARCTPYSGYFELVGFNVNYIPNLS